MSELKSSEGKPNLTPILDMVFQLITFFMVVANFQAASVDRDLNLPVVGSARPVDTRGAEALLILNIDREGNLRAFGRVQRVQEFIEKEATAIRLATGATRQDAELRTLVVIRADRGVQFRYFNRVIKTCQEFGFRQFALKALSKPDRKG